MPVYRLGESVRLPVRPKANRRRLPKVQWSSRCSDGGTGGELACNAFERVLILELGMAWQQ
jgi:hypothetical protein